MKHKVKSHTSKFLLIIIYYSFYRILVLEAISPVSYFAILVFSKFFFLIKSIYVEIILFSCINYSESFDNSFFSVLLNFD